MSQPVDPEFAARVAAYEANHKRGLAFAADGTIGGKAVKPPRPAWRSHVLRHIGRIVFFAVFLKVCVFHIGVLAGYNARAVVILENSSIAEKAMTFVFYPDPISLWASDHLRVAQHYMAFELRKMF